MDIFSSSRDNRGFDWGAFIAGILMVVVAFVLLRHPAKGLHAFVLIFAIVSIVQSIYGWLLTHAFVNFSHVVG